MKKIQKTTKKLKELKIKLEKKEKTNLHTNSFKPIHVLLGNAIKNKKIKLKLTFI